jgi:hypothetical protein
MAIDTVRYAAQEIEKFSPIPNVEDESCREEIVDINFKFVEEVGLNKSPLHPCEDLRNAIACSYEAEVARPLNSFDHRVERIRGPCQSGLLKGIPSPVWLPNIPQS